MIETVVQLIRTSRLDLSSEKRAHLGVEAKEDDAGHLRRLVERYLERKAGAA